MFSGCLFSIAIVTDLLLCNKKNTSNFSFCMVKICKLFYFFKYSSSITVYSTDSLKVHLSNEGMLGAAAASSSSMPKNSSCPAAPGARLWISKGQGSLCQTEEQNCCFFAGLTSSNTQHVSHICAWPAACINTDKMLPKHTYKVCIKHKCRKPSPFR